MATVSGVKMSPDLRLAHVYITVFGDKKRIREALAGFQKSKGLSKKALPRNLACGTCRICGLSKMIPLTGLPGWMP